MKNKGRKLISLLLVMVMVISLNANSSRAWNLGTKPDFDAAGENVESTPSDAVEDDTTAPDDADENDTSASDDADADSESDDADENEETEAAMPAFAAEYLAGGVLVSVSAPEGVFPEGAVLNVSEVKPEASGDRTAAENAEVIEAIENVVDKTRAANVNVAESYTFDIKVLDKDGTEIQPADGNLVQVSFKTAEVKNANLDTNIYHIDETENGSVKAAEKLDVDVTGDTASVDTDGFSYYQVEFTYNDKQFVLQGDESVALTDILSTVGITKADGSAATDADITAAAGSNDSLFTVKNEDGKWIATAVTAFSSEESLKVTVDGVEYEIVVTDDATGGCITFTGSESFTMTVHCSVLVIDGTLQYSTDNVQWETLPSSGDITILSSTSSPYVIYLRGDNNSYVKAKNGSNDNVFSFNKKVACSGNIMTLLDFDNPSNTITGGNNFEFLFNNCVNLTKAPELPATTLSGLCYFGLFYGCTGLTEAPELPAINLKNACYSHMFYGCTSLTEAPELPATTLANGCYYEMFSGCTSLTEAPELPATTLSDECYAQMFYGCTSLTEAPELPATTLARYCYSQMLSGCTSLTEAPELPVTTLADGCYSSLFSGCTSLTEAPELPATTLADACYNKMFSGCTSLTEAPELPATTLASSCYSDMFYGCTSLKNAPELPVTTLAVACYYEMFHGCTSLTEAPELPATTLADACYNGMFGGCTSLTEAPELPATTLADRCYMHMFYGCTSLTELPELPATTLPYRCYIWMFSGCTGIYISENNVGEETIGGNTYTYSIPYRIPQVNDGTDASESLKGMFENTSGSFKGTPAINTTYYLLDIPKTVKAILTDDKTLTVVYDSIDYTVGESFGGNTITKVYNCDSGDSDGAMAEYDSDDRPWKAYVNNISHVEIKKGVTYISREAFRECEALQSVNIPDSVTDMGSGVFLECTALATVTLGNGLTDIPDSAFRGTAITSITIPDGVTNIGEAAFRGSQLENITLPESVTKIEEEAFYGCGELKTVTAPGVKEIGCEAFTECGNLETVELPEVETIRDDAFNECEDLEMVTFPKVKTICSRAFKDTGLTSVEIKSKDTVIADDAFSGVGNYTSTTLILPLDWPIEGMPASNGSWRGGLFTVYTVTYDGNGNNDGSVPTDSNGYTNGYSVTVLGNTGDLEKTGYIFERWNTEADGTGIGYDPDNTFPISTDTVLYAQWKALEAEEPTISTQPQDLELIYGYTAGSVSVTVEDVAGYTFSYQWYLNTEATNEGGTPIADGGATQTYTIPTGKDAETTEYYYCVVTATRNDNGLTASVTSNVATVNIINATMDVTVTPYEGMYDGEVHNITVAADENAVITYSLLESGPYNYVPSFKDVVMDGEEIGAYTVYYKVEKANFNTVTGSSTVKITKRGVTLTSASDSKTYDGTALTKDGVTVTGDGFIEGEGATFSVTGSQTDVGTGGNTFIYTLNEGTKDGNYDITEVEGTLTVTQATANTVTVNIKGWTYGSYDANQNAPEATATFGQEDVTFTYSDSENGTYTSERPVDAGTWYVKATVDETDNYVGGSATKQFEIAKRSVTFTSASDSKTYDGTALTKDGVTVTGEGFVEGEGATFSFTGSQTDVGTGGNTFIYTLNEGTKDGNYDITEVEGTLTVTPATANAVTVNIKGWTYGSYDVAENTPEATATFGQDDVIFTYSDSENGTYTSDIPEDAGIWYVKATVEGTPNYVGGSATKQFEIAKRSITLTSASDTKTYDGTELTNHTVTVTGEGFVNGEGVTYDVTGSQTEGGSSDNTFTYTPDSGTNLDNYNITKVEGTLTVTQETINNVTVNMVGWTYGEAANAPTSTADFGTVTYSYSDEENGDYSPTKPSDAGTWYVKATVVETDSYAGGSATIPFVIAQRSVILTSGTDTKPYDGTALTNDEVIVSGEGFVNGDGATYDVTGTQTDVGFSDNEFTYTLNEGTKAGNYLIITEEGTLTVTQAGFNDVTVDIAGWKYGENAKNPTSTADFGTVTYSYSNAVDGDYTPTKPVDAGTWYVKATVEGTDNYVGGSATKQFEIAKRSVTFTSASDSKTYDGTALTKDGVIVTGEGFVEGEGATFSVTGSQTNVGEGDNTFTYTLNEGTKAGNYDITTAEGKLTVTQAAANTVTVDITGWTYGSYDANQNAPTATATYGQNTVTYTYSDSEDGTYTSDIPEDAGTWYVKATVAGTSNYVGGSAVKEFEIAKRSVTLTSGSDSKTYDGTALTNDVIDVSGAGFVNGDGANYDVTGSQTDVGSSDNTFTYSLNEGTKADNYIINKVTGILTVTGIDLIITADSDSKEYDGTALTKNSFTSTGLAAGDVITSVTVAGSQTEAGESSNVPSNAVIKKGDAVVTGNYNIKYENGTLKVTQAPTNNVTVEIDGWTYGDTPKNPTSTATFGTATYSYSDAENGDYSPTKPVNAGTWYVKATVAETTNYVGGSAVKQFTIDSKAAPSKENLEDDQKPTAINPAYTGEEQPIVTAPTELPEGYDTVKYSTDNGQTWTTDIPKKKDIGDYTVKVKYSDSKGNHDEFAGDDIEAGIKEADKTDLNDAITAAKDYYDSIKDNPDHKDVADELKAKIDAAEDLAGKKDATQSDVDDMKDDVDDAVKAAKQAVKTADDQKEADEVADKINDLTDADDITKDDKAAIEAARKAYDALTPEQKALVDDKTLAKLVEAEKILEEELSAVYSVVSGDGDIWTKGSKTGAVFRFKRSVRDSRTFKNFVGIRVDGQDTASTNYTAVPGSVIVTFNADYLETLSVGEHTVTAIFDGGNLKASAKLIIEDKANDSSGSKTDKGSKSDKNKNESGKSSKKTGDSAPIIPIMVFCVMSLFGIGFTARRKFKKS